MTEPSTKTTAEMNDLLGCLDKGAEYRHATGEYSAFIVQLEQAYPTLRDYIRTLEAKMETYEAQLRVNKGYFTNPKYQCVWLDAADDIDRTLSSPPTL